MTKIVVEKKKLEKNEKIMLGTKCWQPENFLKGIKLKYINGKIFARCFLIRYWYLMNMERK